MAENPRVEQFQIYRRMCLEISSWLETKGIRKSAEDIWGLCAHDSLWPLQALCAAMREDDAWRLQQNSRQR